MALSRSGHQPRMPDTFRPRAPNDTADSSTSVRRKMCFESMPTV
jgi:hypothetical protein